MDINICTCNNKLTSLKKEQTSNPLVMKRVPHCG